MTGDEGTGIWPLDGKNGPATALETAMFRGVATQSHQLAEKPLQSCQRVTATTAEETPSGAEETPTSAWQVTVTTVGGTQTGAEETPTTDRGEKRIPDGGTLPAETAATPNGSPSATANGRASGSVRESGSGSGSASLGGQARRSGTESRLLRVHESSPPALVRRQC